MAGRYRDSSNFMNWYNKLSEERKKEHNRKRHMREKMRKYLKTGIKPQTRKQGCDLKLDT
jgi:hypothetical protein